MYQEKNKFKTVLSSFALVVIELVLMAATTAVFVMGFNHLDTKLAKVSAQKSSSAISVVKSSSVASAAQSSVSKAESLSEQPSSVQQSDDWKLILVNFDNKMPDSFTHTIVHQFNVDIDSRIVTPYQQMHDAAAKDKIRLWISSGYRSSEKQEKLFTDEIQTFRKTGLEYDDAVSKAGKSVARPGYSEHNTGLAIDINGVLESFDGSEAFKWMQQHAQDYGFVLRFQKDKQEITKIKYEPWHFRYVGIENAKKMNEMHLCLEEYVDYLKKNQTASN